MAMAIKELEFPKRLPWTGITLDEWCASPDRVKFVEDILSSALGKDMMSVLVATAPVPDISDATRAGLEAARTRGYQQAIAVLLKMAEFSGTPQSDVPADYSGSVEQMLAEESE